MQVKHLLQQNYDKVFERGDRIENLESKTSKCDSRSEHSHSQVIKIDFTIYVWYVQIILRECNKGQIKLSCTSKGTGRCTKEEVSSSLLGKLAPPCLHF